EGSLRGRADPPPQAGDEDPAPAPGRAGGPEPAGDAVAHTGQGGERLARSRRAHRPGAGRARLLQGRHRGAPPRGGGMTSFMSASRGALVALVASGLFAAAPAGAQSWPPPPQTVPSIGLKTPQAFPPATVPSIGLKTPQALPPATVPSIGLKTPQALPPATVPSIGLRTPPAYQPYTVPSIGLSTPPPYEVPSIGLSTPQALPPVTVP